MKILVFVELFDYNVVNWHFVDAIKNWKEAGGQVVGASTELSARIPVTPLQDLAVKAPLFIVVGEFILSWSFFPTYSSINLLIKVITKAYCNFLILRKYLILQFHRFVSKCENIKLQAPNIC